MGFGQYVAESTQHNEHTQTDTQCHGQQNSAQSVVAMLVGLGQLV